MTEYTTSIYVKPFINSDNHERICSISVRSLEEVEEKIQKKLPSIFKNYSSENYFKKHPTLTPYVKHFNPIVVINEIQMTESKTISNKKEMSILSILREKNLNKILDGI